MLFHFAAVLIFFLLSMAFVFGNLLIGHFARPRNPSLDKLRIYECGEPTIGSSWIRYNIRFYTIALVYLIFDVEVVFLFPAAVVLKKMGALALFEVLTFVLVLVIGLVYAWRYGNLEWISAAETTDERSDAELKELSLGV